MLIRDFTLSQLVSRVVNDLPPFSETVVSPFWSARESHKPQVIQLNRCLNDTENDLMLRKRHVYEILVLQLYSSSCSSFRVYSIVPSRKVEYVLGAETRANAKSAIRAER